MSSESFNSELLTNSTISNNTDNNQPEIESDFIFGDGQDESIVEESTITPIIVFLKQKYQYRGQSYLYNLSSFLILIYALNSLMR